MTNIFSFVESLHVAVLQVDGLFPLPVLVVPEVPVPASVIRTDIRVRVIDEDSSFLLHILSLQVIDDIEPIIEETLIIEVDVEDSILPGYVLVDGPATTVSLAVEKLGLLVVEQPGELVLYGGGGLHQEAARAGGGICQGIRFILYWGGEAEDRGEHCDQHAGCGGDGHGVQA